MMSCPVFIVSLLLSLLVLLGGLFMIAYSKKEGLGKITKIASYVATVFAAFMFISGLICSLMCGSCKGDKCEKGSMECRKEVRIECHEGMENGASCSKDASEDCCKEGMTGNAAHCEKNASEKCCKEGKGECPEAKCEKGMATEKCCKGDKAECSESKCEKGMAAEHCKKDGKDCCKEAIEKCNKEEAAKK